MAKAYSTDDGMRKRCCTCRAELTLDQFHKSSQTSDNLNPRCAACQAVAVRRCMEKKVAMGLPKVTPEQRRSTLQRKKKYYMAAPEKSRSQVAEYRKNNPEKAYASSRRARAKKPEQTRAYATAYYRKNSSTIKPRHAAQAMKRYAKKAGATPAWADPEAIAELYEKAAMVTRKTGVRHEVDHIVPLVSTMVCGLHVEHNLRIIDKMANLIKGNRQWPDQF